VYAPKLKVADDQHAPPALGRGIFAWVRPVLLTKEQDLITQIGLDATIFLRILRMCRNIFVCMAAVGCAVLLPLNLSKSKGKSQFILRATPLYASGAAIEAIAICAWIFNFILCFFLWWNYRVVVALRRQYYDSPGYQHSLHGRTLMVGTIKSCPAPH
jgi:hypothetical protein